MVIRIAYQLIPRSHRGLCGERGGEGGFQSNHPVGLDEDPRLHRAFTGDRADSRTFLHDHDALVISRQCAFES